MGRGVLTRHPKDKDFSTQGSKETFPEHSEKEGESLRRRQRSEPKRRSDPLRLVIIEEHRGSGEHLLHSQNGFKCFCAAVLNLHVINDTKQPELRDEETESDKIYKTHARGHTLLASVLGPTQCGSKDGPVIQLHGLFVVDNGLFGFLPIRTSCRVS